MTVYRTYIHLSSREWGNELMTKLADAYAKCTDKKPVIVTVHEHAGWFLSFLYGAPGIHDGTICGTANDRAALKREVLEWGKGVSDVKFLEDIRR